MFSMGASWPESFVTVDANAEQVRRGMAWVFDKHDKDPAFVKLEERN